MRARLRARNRRPEWLQTQRYVAKERERVSAHSSQKKRGARQRDRVSSYILDNSNITWVTKEKGISNVQF